ncbi:MAG: carbon-phosphorus lyase complex subunit PhnI [Acidimicrobiales bacterium]
MGYVAARGGLDAIRAAEELTRRRRAEAASPWLELDQIIERLPLAVDRVMGEGGLWDEPTAARALRQADGDLIEAAHLIRTYRSTLPRLAYSEVVDADELDVLRRIVPAYREPPGPQLLGLTPDYTGRLLDRTSEDDARDAAARASAAHHDAARATAARADAAPDRGAPYGDGAPAQPRVPGRLLDVLRNADLAVDRRRGDDPEPVDITRVPARPGSGRSARLAVMARAETGALVQLWYRNILGPDNHLHEVTLGEVRHGRLPVPVRHPHIDEPVTIGHIRVTEVEAIEDLNGSDEDRTKFDVGYGLCLGHNERKAIAMANLDIAVERAGPGDPLEQSILMTTDGLDASGFLEHLKLPHYVTFRSMVERKSAMRRAAERRAPAEAAVANS